MKGTTALAEGQSGNGATAKIAAAPRFIAPQRHPDRGPARPEAVRTIMKTGDDGVTASAPNASSPNPINQPKAKK